MRLTWGSDTSISAALPSCTTITVGLLRSIDFVLVGRCSAADCGGLGNQRRSDRCCATPGPCEAHTTPYPVDRLQMCWLEVTRLACGPRRNRSYFLQSHPHTKARFLWLKDSAAPLFDPTWSKPRSSLPEFVGYHLDFALDEELDEFINAT